MCNKPCSSVCVGVTRLLAREDAQQFCASHGFDRVDGGLALSFGGWEVSTLNPKPLLHCVLAANRAWNLGFGSAFTLAFPDHLFRRIRFMNLGTDV